MTLTGIRPKGVDHNGNDQFVIRLSDEFASKDDCVKVVGNIIDQFIPTLPDTDELAYYASKELLVERLNQFKRSIGRFWEYSARSNTMDAYVLECYDIILCLLRSTSWRGWYHSICLGTHKESWISFGEQDYAIFHSTTIEEEYAVEHRFDQQMFDHKPKRAEKDTNGFLYPFGSRMYIPEEKRTLSFPEAKQPSAAKQTPDSNTVRLTSGANIMLVPKPDEISIPKKDAEGNYIKLQSPDQPSIQTQHGRKLVLKTKI